MASRPLSSVNLNHLVALDALLSEGSVTHAAQRIGVSPSALSHTLAALRELFEDPLLIRGREGMSLSPAATQLSGPLRKTLLELQRLIDQGPSFDPATTTREFRVATADFVAMRVAARVIAALTDDAPLARLSIRPLDFRLCTDALERGDVDVLLGPQLSNGESIASEPWSEEPFVCVVRADHPLGDGNLDMQTYARLRHILVSPSGTGTAWVDEKLAERGLSRQVVCRAPSFLVAPMIVADSDLVLTAPRGAIEPFRSKFGLRIVAPPLELPPLQLFMAWHRRDTEDPAHRWFRDLLSGS